MRTDNERIKLIHRRAAILETRREKTLLALSGIVSCLTIMVLGTVMFEMIGLSSIETGMHLTGSSLLSNDAGAYVLVAVISFAAAVIITVLCIHWHKGNMENAESEKGENL
ncbi:MAG: hypothetical protein IJG49_06510 [Erysipelotrichaceae bacterium]|nr:hypothetical protein [Erysipelotrichaceae bacterium]